MIIDQHIDRCQHGFLTGKDMLKFYSAVFEGGDRVVRQELNAAVQQAVVGRDADRKVQIQADGGFIGDHNHVATPCGQCFGGNQGTKTTALVTNQYATREQARVVQQFYRCSLDNTAVARNCVRHSFSAGGHHNDAVIDVQELIGRYGLIELRPNTELVQLPDPPVDDGREFFLRLNPAP